MVARAGRSDTGEQSAQLASASGRTRDERPDRLKPTPVGAGYLGFPRCTATRASRLHERVADARTDRNSCQPDAQHAERRPRASAGSPVSELSAVGRLGGAGGFPGGRRAARTVSGTISGGGRTAGPRRDGAGCRWPGRWPRAADPPKRPRDPQRSPVPGAFALPHLTDWNGRTETRAPVGW